MHKDIKLPPCASATAIGDTIDYVSIEYSASKGISGVTKGNFIHFFVFCIGEMISGKFKPLIPQFALINEVHNC